MMTIDPMNVTDKIIVIAVVVIGAIIVAAVISNSFLVRRAIMNTYNDRLVIEDGEVIGFDNVRFGVRKRAIAG